MNKRLRMDNLIIKTSKVLFNSLKNYYIVPLFATIWTDDFYLFIYKFIGHRLYCKKSFNMKSIGTYVKRPLIISLFTFISVILVFISLYHAIEDYNKLLMDSTRISN